MLERTAGLLKHEAINLVSSEKNHYGGKCPLTGQDLEEEVWLDSGTWVKEVSR